MQTIAARIIEVDDIGARRKSAAENLQREGQPKGQVFILDIVQKTVKNEDLTLLFRASGEASVFVEIVNQFAADIRRLGPLGGGGDRLKPPEIFKKLEAATAVLAGEKMRWIIGKQTPFMESGNKYGEIFTEHEFNRAIDMIIIEETEAQEILGQLQAGSQSVKDMAAHLGIPSERVLRYILALIRKGMVTLETVRQRTPIYQIVPIHD